MSEIRTDHRSGDGRWTARATLRNNEEMTFGVIDTETDSANMYTRSELVELYCFLRELLMLEH